VGLRSIIHKMTAPPHHGHSPSGPVKMILIVNNGLKMGKGKIAAQVGHASVQATLNAGQKSPLVLDAWLSSGQKKVCLKGDDADHLLALEKLAIEEGLLTSKVHDAGHTQIPSGSLTVLAIGPCQDESVEKITGSLKLL
jgi:PTH2 family peptidyl-tRNA hydrolase